MIETLNKMGREGMHRNIIEVIYDKPIANVILNGEKLKAIRNKTRMPTLTTLIQHSSVSPNK